MIGVTLENCIIIELDIDTNRQFVNVLKDVLPEVTRQSTGIMLEYLCVG